VQDVDVRVLFDRQHEAFAIRHVERAISFNCQLGHRSIVRCARAPTTTTASMLSLLIVAIVLSYTWLFAPMLPRAAAAVPVALVLAIALFRGFRTDEWGLTPAAFLPALARTTAMTALAAAAIGTAGWRAGTWHDAQHVWSRLAILLPWALGQQFVLQTSLLRDAQRAAGRSPGIVLAACAFAALHAPNPLLTAATFVGAIAWCWVYDRYPHVVPPTLSHAILTLVILYAFDNDAIGGLRVGAAYRR
jgi:membrane protease YdiL (CAAX protease family)